MISDDDGETVSAVPETVENPDEFAPARDHIEFSEDLPESEGNLKVIDQCVILALWYVRSFVVVF